MPRPILVTGLDGFTGSHLGPVLLATDHEVHDLACDIRDYDQVSTRVKELVPEVVLHLAGIANVAHSDVGELYLVNVVGSRNLFAALAALDSPPRNVIVASSATVYGNSSVSPITEDTPLDPTNDYAVSKTATEYLLRSWRDRLRFTIVRPFNYTGLGQTANFVVPKIVDHFRRRADVIELGNTHVVREYGDVRRTVDAYARLCARDGDNGIYNLASGRGVTLDEVIRHCSDITGHHPEIVVNPAFVRPHEVDTLVGSAAKLESLLGPLPQFPIRETLEWMLSEPPPTTDSR